MVILHPTDFSRGAHAALGHALDVARRERARLVLVHVVEPITFGDTEYMARELALRDAARAAARKALGRLQAAARRAGVPAELVLLDGGAAKSIVDCARRRRAHLIVMGTHGRTGLRRLVLGSVAANVLATASCPVLTVRMTGAPRRRRRPATGARVARPVSRG